MEITTNTAVLADEFLSHRLGLLPLYSSGAATSLVYGTDCSCEQQCPACSVILNLAVSCEEDGKTLEVTSKMITVGEGGGQWFKNLQSSYGGNAEEWKERTANFGMPVNNGG